MGELNFCVFHDIIKTAYEQLINDLSTDLGLPYLVTRLFHNKVFSLIFASLRCYFLYFDLTQLARYVPRILIPLIGYAFWDKRFRKIIVPAQTLIPFFFIFNPLHLSLGGRIETFGIYYSVLGLIGGIKLLTRRQS